MVIAKVLVRLVQRLYDDASDVVYDVDLTKDFGITAIGYRFTPKGCDGKEIYVHASQYKMVIVEKYEPE